MNPGFSFAVNNTVLWIVYSVVLVIFAIMSLVFIYHWRTYGSNSRALHLTEGIYVVVGILLLIVSAIFISIH